MADAPKIPKTATTHIVRGELSRISTHSEWLESDYWNYFLGERREIFNDIYNVFPDYKGRHTNPSVGKKVTQQFVVRAKERWKGEFVSWMADGAWLDNRDDIVSWMWQQDGKRFKNIESEKPPADASSQASTATIASAAPAMDTEIESTSKKWWDAVI